jgi:hypothetical protein
MRSTGTMHARGSQSGCTTLPSSGLGRDRRTLWLPHHICPAGVKTGGAISPPGGYVGDGLQLQVDIGIGPAGDVWVTNNWQDPASCYGKPVESASTRCGRQGVVVFFGMAIPVHTPPIGPVQAAN